MDAGGGVGAGRARRASRRSRSVGRRRDVRVSSVPLPVAAHSGAYSDDEADGGLRRRAVHADRRRRRVNTSEALVRGLYAGARPLTLVERGDADAEDGGAGGAGGGDGEGAASRDRQAARRSGSKLKLRRVMHAVHLAVAVAVSASLAQLSHTDLRFARGARRDWNELLFPRGMGPSSAVTDSLTVSGLEELRDTAERFVGVYFDVFANNSVEHYERAAGGVRLDVLRSIEDGSPLTSEQYFLEPASLGPLDYSGDRLTDFLASAHALTLRFGARRFGFENGRRLCHDYDVHYTMAFDTRATLTGRLYYNVEFCPGLRRALEPSALLSANAAVMLLTAASAALLAARAWLPGRRGDVEFNHRVWWAVYALTDAVNLFTASLDLDRRYASAKLLDDSAADFSLAASGMLSWVRLVPAAMVLGPKYAALGSTLSLAMPMLVRFVIGVAPIYIGFAFFGVQAFGTASFKFHDLDQTAASLFAILNGDMLLASYVDLQQKHHVMGEIYLYSFMILFITIVSKMVLSGVEFFYFRTTPATEVVEYVALAEEKKKQQHGGGAYARPAVGPLLPSAPEPPRARTDAVRDEVASLQDELMLEFAREAARAGAGPGGGDGRAGDVQWACRGAFDGVCARLRESVPAAVRQALAAKRRK